MAVHHLVFLLNHTHGNIGAVIRNPLNIGQQVVEYKAQLNGAASGLQTLNVAQPDFLNQVVNCFFQGLDTPGGIWIIGGKASEGVVHNILQGGEQNTHLYHCLVRKMQVLVVEFLSRLLQIQRMIADAFKITDSM